MVLRAILVAMLIAVSSVKAQSSICSQCLSSAGINHDADPDSCDDYYVCPIDGSSPIKMHCPVGTFYNRDMGICTDAASTNCPLAQCTTASEGSTLRSNVDCRVYYMCTLGSFQLTTCPQGTILANGACDCTGQATNLNEESCEDLGLLPDPTGSVCSYVSGNHNMQVPAGTFWNQTTCHLEHTSTLCNSLVRSRELVTTPSDVCDAAFLAAFTNGVPWLITSPRLGINITSDRPKDRSVEYRNNAVYFSSNTDNAYVYFYFFSNKEFMENTAFRVRFYMQNYVLGIPYTLLSNAFCTECPETIYFSVFASSSNSRTVRAQITNSANQTYGTNATINLSDDENFVELLVIYGAGYLHGQVREVNRVNPNTIVQQVPLFNVTIPRVSLKSNRCGLILGNSFTTSSQFVGAIDEFAFYEMCADINELLLNSDPTILPPA